MCCSEITKLRKEKKVETTLSGMGQVKIGENVKAGQGGLKFCGLSFNPPRCNP